MQKLEIVYRHVDSLIPDPSNLRLHPERNLNTIRASLRKFGQQKPIVINDKNIVIAGNGILDGAKLEGWTHVACVVTDLDNSQQLQFAITDNRASELSDWDYSGLANTIEGMLEANEWDLEDVKSIGFEDYELEPLLSAEWSIPEEEDDYERASYDEDGDDPGDAHPGRREFRELVARVVEKARRDLEDAELAEKDALRYCYKQFLGEADEYQL